MQSAWITTKAAAIQFSGANSTRQSRACAAAVTMQKPTPKTKYGLKFMVVAAHRPAIRIADGATRSRLARRT